MEQDIKDIELFIDFCRAPYNFEQESEEKSYKELSYKIEHLIKAYKELEEKWYKDTHKLQNDLDLANADKINNYIPVSLVEEKILNPIKEEHDKAIKGFIKRDIPQCIEDGGIAQELGYFIGKIEELLEKRK